MAEEDNPAPAPAAKLGIVQIVIIVVLVGATQVGVAFLLDIIKPPPPPPAAEGAAAPAPESLEPANYLPLDPALVVNFDHNGKGRFLQTTVQVMTRNTAVLEEARTHSPAIRSALISLLGGIDYDTVMAPGGKDQLQFEALEVANGVLEKLAGSEPLESLYFTSFVIQ
ncbi:MAG: flagellar basal body-associated FliL family protein [Pseudomonadota bacterium]